MPAEVDMRLLRIIRISSGRSIFSREYCCLWPLRLAGKLGARVEWSHSAGRSRANWGCDAMAVRVRALRFVSARFDHDRSTVNASQSVNASAVVPDPALLVVAAQPNSLTSASHANEAIQQRVWKMPYPYGASAAIESMSGIAAALLAGFSVTLLGVVAQAPTSFRWPGAALIGLLVTAILLIACVQVGFRARKYIYSRADFEQWCPQPVENQQEEDDLRDMQAADYAKWKSRQRI